MICSRFSPISTNGSARCSAAGPKAETAAAIREEDIPAAVRTIPIPRDTRPPGRPGFGTTTGTAKATRVLTTCGRNGTAEACSGSAAGTLRLPGPPLLPKRRPSRKRRRRSAIVLASAFRYNSSIVRRGCGQAILLIRPESTSRRQLREVKEGLSDVPSRSMGRL